MDRTRAAMEVAQPEPEGGSSLGALARLASAGDGVATGKLLRALAPRLIAVVRAVLGAGHADLDDAVQQALIGFVQALPAFRGECEPVSYARVIAVRAAIAARKRSRVDQARRDDLDDTGVASDAPTPGEEAVQRRRKELLRDLLAELPAEQAEVLALRVVLGCSLEEVAAQSAVPLNTVRSRLRLAKERLKARIERDPDLLDAMGVVP
jgi:RNA polymerase sigma-70 factor (ECF subfamily)